MAKASLKLNVEPQSEIKALMKDLQRTPSARAAHLTNLAICGLKYLVLKGESDALRLQACKALLETSPVQTKLGNMSKAMGHYHQHVHVDATSQALVEKLTQALTNGKSGEVLDLLSPTESVDISPNSLETNETP